MSAGAAPLTAMGLAFPSFDPVAIALGPIAIRWYAIAYIVGIVLGWRYALKLSDRPPKVVTRAQLDDFLVWATLGIILGGRLGYVLFYKPGYYLFQPWEALYVWRGGMSFHGGMLGVVIAIVAFARQQRIKLLALADICAAATPIGLFFGRLANFVNGELWGRPSDVPWAMVFPHGGPLARHPSQLYEAGLEGVVLFAVLSVLAWRLGWRDRPGRLTGAFLVGYGIARIACEMFREPDAHLGFLISGLTMGQLLSVPMIAAGAWLIRRSLHRPVLAS